MADLQAELARFEAELADVSAAVSTVFHSYSAWLSLKVLHLYALCKLFRLDQKG